MRACAICAARPAQGCHSAGDPPCGPSSRVWRRFCEIRTFTPSQHPLKGPKSGHVAVENHFANFAVCSRFDRFNPTFHKKSSSVFSGVPYSEKSGAWHATQCRGGRGHHKGRGMEARAIRAVRPGKGCHSAEWSPCVPSGGVWRRFCEI